MVTFDRRRDETHVRLHDAPIVPGYGQVRITPISMVFETREGRTRVRVFGMNRQNYRTSAYFNVSGYDNNKAAPRWIMDIAAELGLAQGSAS